MEHTDVPGNLDVGRPGASAQAEFERRRRTDAERRRRRYGRLLAPVVAALAGVRPSTARWRVGARAEQRVGRLLSDAVAGTGIVLHDRSIPRRQANIDHLAIVPSGVWVIDTKCYRGRVRHARPPGRLVGRRTLVVNGRDRAQLLVTARNQRALVQSATGPGTPVRAALCFAGAERGLPSRPVSIDGVLVTWPKALARVLDTPGPVGPDQQVVVALATRLAGAFPPRTVRPGPGGPCHVPHRRGA